MPPKSIYDESKNLFNDRKLYKYRTAQLVRDSKLVIGQSSTSTSFPILFNKPLIFITTKELMSSRYYLDVRGLQYFINNHIIDADQFIKQNINGLIRRIDSSIIKKYTILMLKTNNSNEGSLAEIISNGLLKYIYS